MKSSTEYLTLNIPARMDFVNMTPQVEDCVRKSGVREGLCLVNAKSISNTQSTAASRLSVGSVRGVA
jgi:thiamine phosphate synthase YjbQ (UPF0047 family)